MSILNSLKSMVGVGTPKVEVKLQKTKAAVMESVKGVATFTGGEYPATIDEIVLRMLTVEELKEKDKKKESTEKVGKISFNDYVLEPKEVISIPFQIIIPKENLITSSAIKHFVQVEIAINGQNASGECGIEIH